MLNVLVRFVGDVTQLSASIGAAQGQMAAFKTSMVAMAPAMTKIGMGMSAAISLPLLAIGAYSIKTAYDFDKSMAFINTIAHRSRDDLGVIADEIIAIARKVPQSATDIAMATYQIMSAGFTEVADAQKLAEASAIAATAGMADTEDAAKALTTAMLAFGRGIEDVTPISDILFKGVERGVFRFGDLGKALGSAAGTAAQVGVSLEELMAMFTVTTKRGLELSRTAAGLNYLFLAFIKVTDQQREAFAKMGVEVGAAALQQKGFTGALVELVDALGISQDELDGLGDASEEAYRGFIRMKTGSPEATEAITEMFPSIMALRAALALTSDGLQMYLEDLGEMEKATDGVGATMKAFDKAMDSTWGQLQLLKSNAQTAAIALGNIMLPILNKVIAAFTKLFSAIAALPKPIQTLLVILGALAASIGPILLVTGGLVQAFVALKAVLPIAQAALLKFGVTATIALGKFALIALAIAAVVFAIMKIVEVLKRSALPEIKHTSNEVVNEFVKMSEGARKELSVMAWSGATMTEQMRDDVVNNVKSMVNQVVTELQRQKGEALRAFEALVAAGGIPADQAAMIRASIVDLYEPAIQEMQQYFDEYNNIVAQAAAENRGITTQEAERLEALLVEIRRSGIDALSADVNEQRMIYESLAQNKGKIDAAMARDAVKSSHDQLQAIREGAEEQFEIQRNAFLRLGMAGMPQAEVDRLIQAAEELRDKQIGAAQTTHHAVVREAAQMAGKYVDRINWATGESLSYWDMLFTFKRVTSMRSLMESMRAGDAELSHEEMIRARIRQLLEQERDARLQAISDARAAARQEYAETLSAIRADYGERTEAEKNYQRQRTEFARSSLDATIAALNEERDRTRDTSRTRMDLVREAYNLTRWAIQRESDALRDAHRERIDQLREQYREKIRVINLELDATLANYQNQIDAIDEQTAAEERALRDQQDAERIQELQSQIDTEKNAGRRAELQKQLNDLLAQVERRHLLEAREQEKAAIREQMELARQAAQEEKDRLETEHESMLQRLEEELTAKLAALESETQALEEQFHAALERLEEEGRKKEEVEAAKLAAALEALDAEEEATNQWHEDMLANEEEHQGNLWEEFLKRHASTIEAYEAEIAMIEAVGRSMMGLKDIFARAVEWVQPIIDAVKTVASYLPFSLAKKGPFSKPVNWGVITEGLDDVMARWEKPGLSGGPVASPVVRPIGGGDQFNITMPGMVIREEADIDKLSRAFAQEVERVRRSRG